MTALRDRMIEDMQLRGLSANTQEAYVRAAKQLAEYYHRSPEELSQKDLRQYLSCQFARGASFRDFPRRSACSAFQRFSAQSSFREPADAPT